MSKHSFKDWFTVTRYWSFPVSTMPVLATFAYLFSENLLPGGFKPYLVFILCLLGVVVLHSAGNVLSDWFDYKSGVDNENAFAVPNLVFHHFEPKEYLNFSIILFVVGVLIGVSIALLSGPALWIIGGVGVLLTILYSFLKYHALGDLDIFIIFGVLPVIGTAYAVTGVLHWDALVLSLPIGIITVSVLHANNTVDIVSDGAAGIKTFAMLIGGKASSILYSVYMVIPFLCVIGAVAVGRLHPMALLCLVAAIPAWKNLKQACGYDKLGIEALKGLDQGSAKLQMAFSVLLSAGLFISRML
jgi:1,4-dihydroxy-2-naphthoate octaprenyltransferase